MLVGADAAQPASDHDANSRAQRLGLLHVVRREHHGALLPGRRHVADDVPHQPPCCGVHARARLVQQDERRRAHQRDRQRQLSLVPAAEGHRHLVHVGTEGQALHHGVAILPQHGAADALDPPEELQVLPHRQPVQECVVLGAVAEQPPHLPLLHHDVVAAQPRLTARGQDRPRQHVERARLPRAVDAQEAEALAHRQGEAQAVHRDLGPALRGAVDLPEPDEADDAVARRAAGGKLRLLAHVLVDALALLVGAGGRTSDGGVQELAGRRGGRVREVVYQESQGEVARACQVQVHHVLARDVPAQEVQVDVQSELGALHTGQRRGANL
mmetsp:Transcript_85266/g.231030  ORF Transcript_85266/g.231030 Transcript_85266/m.231030 type:complete len:328 (+) Transcript_85266:842-1825(+)